MYSRLFCGTFETSIEDSNLTEDHRGIKLYKIELLRYQASVPDLINLLSASERNRANRYHFEKDKNRFVICRALLKIFLAEHMGIDITQIVLDIDSNKKPYLASHPSVFFNVSHAGDYALIAIAKSPVGVDIEFVNRDFNYNEILPNIFNKIEIEEVNQSTDKQLTFYKFWTRKEAVVKAIGTGIDDNSPKIPVTDGLHSLPLSLVGDFNQISVYGFKINEDHIGAIALIGDQQAIDSITFHPLPTSAELKNSTLK